MEVKELNQEVIQGRHSGMGWCRGGYENIWSVPGRVHSLGGY